jgi:putative oxidoreductase
MKIKGIGINQLRRNPLLTNLFRLILGAVFIYAGVQKISSPADFAVAIENYLLLPAVLINPAAIILPWLEIFCGVFLIAGIFIRASAILVSVMTLVFIIAIFSALIRGLDITCGCFAADTPVDWLKIVEDFVLLGMSLHLVYYFTSEVA